MHDRLNFNHLRCFWAVARDGSIARACARLGLTQPTISKQIGDLEEALDAPLFRRSGRRLVLTDLGRSVYAYADDIFALGQELLDAVRGHAPGKPLRLHVGVSDVVPKLLTRLVLEPALRIGRPVRLVCREAKTDQLLADLALSGLDVVLTDAPLPPGSRIKAYNHLLGESPVTLFAPPGLASEAGRGFPESLNGAPLLLPTDNTTLRRSIDAWLERHDLRPTVVAEFEDSALLKAFAEAGHGLFFAPAAVQGSVAEQFGVRPVRTIEDLKEIIYAVTLDRRITHPGVTAIVEEAQRRLRPVDEGRSAPPARGPREWPR